MLTIPDVYYYVAANPSRGSVKFISAKTINWVSRNDRKHTFAHVRLAKIQISLLIGIVWSESSLGAFWLAKAVKFLHADNEDSDQTVRMEKKR